MKRKILHTFLFSSLLLFFYTCTGELVFSPLVNDRISVKFKGTYESNAPYDWGSLHEDDGLTGLIGGPFTGKQMDIDSTAITEADLQWFIDIAEIRISTENNDPDDYDADEYWDYFARDRVLMCSTYSSNDSGKSFKTCKEQSGVDKLADFFDEGISYPSTDVSSGTYRTLGIYFRKFITSPATFYDSNGENPYVPEVQFDNQSVEGYNIENLLNGTPSSEDDTLLFPLLIQDLDLQVPGGEEPYRIEIRFFLKNLMMKHAAAASVTVNDISYSWLNFLGLSDWKANHQYDSVSGDAGLLGENIIATARLYNPDNVGSIQVTGMTSTTSQVDYVVAIPAGQSFDPLTQLPYAATQADGTITNLPPGDYDVYHTCDLTTNTATGTDTIPDGYPETVSSTSVSVTVTADSAVTADLSALSCL